MDILSRKDHSALLGSLGNIRATLGEWLFVNLHLIASDDKELTAAKAAEMMRDFFRGKEGKIYIGDDREILVLVRWKEMAKDAEKLAGNLRAHLPVGFCSVLVSPSTLEGLANIEVWIAAGKNLAPSFAALRAGRAENVVLVADDDMYIRFLLKKGASTLATVQEAADGSEVLSAYRACVPDILFLDIHMPNATGTEVMKEVLTFDPSAYIIMLSADSTPENVLLTTQQGARGFMTKPFTKEKLQDMIRACPTIAQPSPAD